MTAAIGYRLCVAGAVVALAAAVLRFRHELRMTAPMAAFARPAGEPAPYLVRVDRDIIDSLSTVVSDHDPFRVSHEPSDVAYAADRPNMPGLPSAAPKPPITLTGTIGPPWAAVLEAVPGHDGSWLAKVGDTLSRAPFAVTVLRRITRDTIVLSTADTTWKLTVRAAWR